MNKKTNTVLFILGATVFNLIVMAVLMAVLFVIIALLGLLQQPIGQFLLIVAFFAALVGSFFIYGFAMKKLSAKIDMDKYFEPIFKKKRT
jgi:hypothetical protein